MARKHLEAVRRAAGRVDAARAGLGEAVRQASLSGESLRDIAPYAGLKPTRVGELVREAERAAAEKESRES